jgi:mRNA interferase YafQ
MRRIETTGVFKKDFRRVKASPRHRDIDNLLAPIVQLLAMDAPLPLRSHDHSLGGDWSDHRECHLKPDLLLIYSKPDPDCLRLVRLGSHSELFGK